MRRQTQVDSTPSPSLDLVRRRQRHDMLAATVYKQRGILRPLGREKQHRTGASGHSGHGAVFHSTTKSFLTLTLLFTQSLASQGCLEHIASALRRRQESMCKNDMITRCCGYDRSTSLTLLLPMTAASLGIADLRHFLYKNKSSAQYTSPSIEPPYTLPGQEQRWSWGNGGARFSPSCRKTTFSHRPLFIALGSFASIRPCMRICIAPPVRLKFTTRPERTRRSLDGWVAEGDVRDGSFFWPLTRRHCTPFLHSDHVRV